MIKIKFSFHGGAREVGRSCIQIEFENFSLMLDCGVKLRQDDGCPVLPEHTDALILSHAHLDHSGMVPALYRKNRLPIYSTDITFEISHMLQRDSVKINKLRREKEIYTNNDINEMRKSEICVNYGEKVKLRKNISFEMIDAGHIPGSASILIEMDDLKILYTGDIKTVDTYLQRGARVPRADILIIESTYGNKIHPNRKELEREFIDVVDETLRRKGIAVIAAFAVGRTQEVLMMLRNLSYPIYLDGMGQDITRIFMQYPKYLRNPELLKESARTARWITNNEERRKAILKPSIIVTTAGMLNGGPILRYIQKLKNDKKSSVILTGYQVEGTNGRLLMENGYIVDESNNKKISVKMEKHQFDFSAHAGRNSLERIARDVNPEIAFVVHGDQEPATELGKFLTTICEKVYVPEVGDVIEI
ncbi:MAG: MBL fold metallo-hydrolase [Candidatus Altiarchaeales archaeon]|nr:MAG: MBL fold metallo-hydrolase [Candidatus Altiarchaeales archaeon]